MSTITPAPPASTPAPLASPSVYRMTVDEYERLAAARVLDDPRVELIDGLLVKKMTQKPPHVWAVEAVHEHLERILPPGWFIREEKPVRIPLFDEPEPDLSVIRGTRNDYRGRHPGPGDIALLVEVAESSLDRDQGEKRAAYAQGGIPLYWIVNLIGGQVETYSNPGAGDYQSSQVLGPGQDILVVIDGVEVGRIAVTDVLP